MILLQQCDLSQYLNHMHLNPFTSLVENRQHGVVKFLKKNTFQKLQLNCNKKCMVTEGKPAGYKSFLKGWIN